MAEIALLGKGLNLDSWDRITILLRRLGHRGCVFDDHEAVVGVFDLGLLVNYRRIVPKKTLQLPRAGFVLFHSSDLPKGRGWAPIYETIVTGSDLVVSMLRAVEDVDSGPIIAKGRYPLDGVETAAELRAIDDEIALRMLEVALDPLLAGDIHLRDQDPSAATWVERRRPSQSVIDIAKPIAAQLDHLRALPEEAPAFFEYRGRRFALRLEAAADARVVFDASRLRIESSIDDARR